MINRHFWKFAEPSSILCHGIQSLTLSEAIAVSLRATEGRRQNAKCHTGVTGPLYNLFYRVTSDVEGDFHSAPFFHTRPSFLLELGGKKTKNLDVLQLFGFIRSLHGMRVLQLYDVMRDGGVYCDGSETWQVVPQQCPVSLYKRN